jgi:hypothetical protein
MALDGARHRKKMVVVLHGKALVAALIQMPPSIAVTVAMPAAHVRGCQAVHERRQLAILARPQQQMPMTAHQAIGQEAHRHDLERGLDHALEGGEVAVVVKEVAAVVWKKRGSWKKRGACCSVSTLSFVAKSCWIRLPKSQENSLF